MKYGSDLGSVCYIHELRKRFGVSGIYLCSLFDSLFYSNQLFGCLLSSGPIEHGVDVPQNDDFDDLNPVSS
jgi:hypothetical protein